MRHAASYFKRPALFQSSDDYLPIEDYGAIGNLRTVALVGRNGSIDWCSFPELNRPSVFSALLDHRKGGHFRVAPIEANWSDQQYVEDSNVLETVFETDYGRLSVIDFMPLGGYITGPVDPHTVPEICRLLRCDEGAVEVEVEWAPRFDYARAPTSTAPIGGGFLSATGSERMVLVGLPIEGEVVEGPHGPLGRARFCLREGEEIALLARYGASAAQYTTEECQRALEETIGAWEKWLNRSVPKGWAGRWSRQVLRSTLVLKLLTHPDTGAVAAAATTSLPEQIGGVRNWDYRFSWIRDSSLSVQALLAVGHNAEACAFLEWLVRVAYEKGVRDYGLQILYGLHGESAVPEVNLEHLEGYMGSRPVRIGNGAVDQEQHGVFGQLLSSAYELFQRGEDLAPDVRRCLARLVDKATEVWREPDYGIWEIPLEPKHYVSSKWLVWVALDRAIRLAERRAIEGDLDRWRKERDAVRQDVLAHGYDEEVGAFVMAYGSKALDASNLLIPTMGFLPADDPRVQGTIDRTIRRLTDNGLVYRYLADDGLPGAQGTFLACTFWLVDALALSGRVEEARAIFDHAAEHANHLGLYSEEMDARTGRFLGNFPQGLSHIAFINSALYLADAEGHDVPLVPRSTEAVETEQAGRSRKGGDGASRSKKQDG